MDRLFHQSSNFSTTAKEGRESAEIYKHAPSEWMGDRFLGGDGVNDVKELVLVDRGIFTFPKTGALIIPRSGGRSVGLVHPVRPTTSCH